MYFYVRGEVLLPRDALKVRLRVFALYGLMITELAAIFRSKSRVVFALTTCRILFTLQQLLMIMYVLVLIGNCPRGRFLRVYARKSLTIHIDFLIKFIDDFRHKFKPILGYVMPVPGPGHALEIPGARRFGLRQTLVLVLVSLSWRGSKICLRLILHKSVFGILSIKQVIIALIGLFELFLRAHDDIVVVLHLAEAREDGHADVTVPLDAVNGECLSHLLFYAFF